MNLGFCFFHSFGRKISYWNLKQGAGEGNLCACLPLSPLLSLSVAPFPLPHTPSDFPSSSVPLPLYMFCLIVFVRKSLNKWWMFSLRLKVTMCSAQCFIFSNVKTFVTKLPWTLSSRLYGQTCSARDGVGIGPGYATRWLCDLEPATQPFCASGSCLKNRYSKVSLQRALRAECVNQMKELEPCPAFSKYILKFLQYLFLGFERHGWACFSFFLKRVMETL